MDVQAYAFDLTLSDTTDAIQGEATVEVAVTADTLTVVRLDLIGPPERAGEPGMRVEAVLEKGAAVPFVQRANEVRIRPAEGLETGSVRTFTIRYRGIPADGLIIGTNQHGDRTFFGDNWPNRARHWLPVVDHLADKATVAWSVTAPARYEVVANGVQEADTTMGAMRTTRWRTGVPLPPKVMVIGVADFAIDTAGTVDGVPVQSWVYPQDREVGFQDLGQAPGILRFFEDNLGPYPYEKLANVQSTTRYGGMENASAIFYSERAVADGEDSETLLAHEIAHQWFGNTATEADWPHLWLSEGMATYLTALWLEDEYDPKRLADYMAAARRSVVQFHARNPTEPLVDTTYSDPNELLNVNPYRKGAWVLHMLRQEVGTDAFWDGLRAYYTAYRNQNATTTDFRRVMEDASGQDLSGFFAQWTRRAGHPVLDVSHTYDAGTCTVTVRQTQDAAPFRLPLEVALAPDRIETIPLTGRETTATFDCEAPIESIAVDPKTKVLAEF